MSAVRCTRFGLAALMAVMFARHASAQQFQPVVNTAVDAVQTDFQVLLIGDLNGDGRPDLVTGKPGLFGIVFGQVLNVVFGLWGSCRSAEERDEPWTC